MRVRDLAPGMLFGIPGGKWLGIPHEEPLLCLWVRPFKPHNTQNGVGAVRLGFIAGDCRISECWLETNVTLTFFTFWNV